MQVFNTVLLFEKNDCLFSYSEPLDVISDYNNHQKSPVCIQELIQSKMDLRVTIIKGVIYAVKILRKDKSNIFCDWRKNYKDDLIYEDVSLPKDIEKKCFLLMKKLKLNFGAIDLLYANGKYYFLEINPTGEWGWLNNKNRQISFELAKALQNGAKNEM